MDDVDDKDPNESNNRRPLMGVDIGLLSPYISPYELIKMIIYFTWGESVVFLKYKSLYTSNCNISFFNIVIWDCNSCSLFPIPYP